MIDAISEYNKKGCMVYADKYIGAYARGRTEKEAVDKLPIDAANYLAWLNGEKNVDNDGVRIIQRKESTLQVCDADSDVIFESERQALNANEYVWLKSIAMKSANDFLTLYNSIADKKSTTLQPRKTFYGDVPITAQEMYEHTKNVNSYYFGEIGIDVSNEGDISSCRTAGFALLESKKEYLHNTIYNGSYDEEWSLRKVIRRFIWHDRIHARAMYRMAKKLCGEENITNTFFFDEK